MALRPWLLGSSIALVLAFGQGCSGSQEEESEGEESALSTVNAKSLPTSLKAARLLQGYNPLIDQLSRESCVTPSLADRSAIEVGGVENTFQLTHANAKSDLAKEFNMDIGLNFRIPKVGGDATAQAVNTLKRSSTSSSMVVRVTKSYGVNTTRGFAIKQKDLLVNKPLEFLRTCGAKVITGVRYEAQFVAVVTFDTKTQEQAKQIQAAVKAQGSAKIPKVAVAQVGADLKSKVAQATAAAESNVSVKLFTSGFNAAGKVAVNGAGLETFQGGPELLSKVDQLLAALNDSVESAREKDFQSYDADVAQGRLVNLARVELTDYESAGGTSIPNSAFNSLSQPLLEAEQFLRSFTDLDSQIDGVRDELGSFLRAGTDQHRYNAITSPLASTMKVGALAQRWAPKFAEEGPASVAPAVDGALNTCLAGVRAADFGACKGAPTSHPAYTAAVAQINEYAKQRIARLSFTDLPQRVSFPEAEKACQAKGARLPTPEEIRFLAPATAAAGGAAWVARAACPGSKGGLYLLPQNEAEAEPVAKASFSCDGNWFTNTVALAGSWFGTDAAAFCVSGSGPRVEPPAPGRL